MIVDDEPHLATTLRMLLQERCDVVATTQSEQAVRILIEGAPVDVVLCDLMMPDPNGIEVFRRVVERRPELKERFIFMTGGTFTDRAARFRSAVRSAFLDKPLDMRRLRSVLRAIGPRASKAGQRAAP